MNRLFLFQETAVLNSLPSPFPKELQPWQINNPALMKSWCAGAMRSRKKQRRIISFEETVDIKIKSLKSWIFPETAPLGGWECREFHYTRQRERQFVDDAWRPIGVGESWGGPDMSALFRCRAQMPAHFAGKKVVLKLYFGGDGLLSLNGQAVSRPRSLPRHRAAQPIARPARNAMTSRWNPTSSGISANRK